MLDQIQPENLLFIDIETVPAFSDYEKLSDEMKILWDKKSSYISKQESEPSEAYARAGIYSEFGKIICISAGIVYHQNGERNSRIKSFFGDDEKIVLESFKSLLEDYSKKKDFSLCAHNGKEFDFPYIARRMLINGIKLPEMLDIAGKKPWEIRFMDTMELWKFGDYKNYTSLELLARVFDIPTPKDDIDGSMVAKVYYEEKDIKRIARYCEKDVLTIIQLLLRFKAEPVINKDNIFFASEEIETE
jgi:predicted PolB exonuclease-like 3'-5' exonuclease